jgi:hypothetical protein
MTQFAGRVGVARSNVLLGVAWMAALAASGSIVRAQEVGSFAPTGNMVEERYGFTATLLEDGRVLIAGGAAPRTWFNAIASAEIYDPQTGTFTATGSMATARSHHAAVRLPDGKVLIAGGYRYRGGTASAELYNPQTGAFEPTGPMTAAQANTMAVLLGNGKALFIGGNAPYPGESTPVDAELYDPASGTFESLGWQAACSPTATVLKNGKVLITAGWRSWVGRIYDPATGEVSFNGALTSPAAQIQGLYWHTATLLQDGKVLITGGDNSGDNSNPLANAELYDPDTGKFTPTGSLSIPRLLHTATLLPEGSVLIAGRGTAEFYNPESGKFYPLIGMVAVTETTLAAIPLLDGRVLFVGTGSGLNAELYIPPVRPAVDEPRN